MQRYANLLQISFNAAAPCLRPDQIRRANRHRANSSQGMPINLTGGEERKRQVTDALSGSSNRLNQTERAAAQGKIFFGQPFDAGESIIRRNRRHYHAL